VPLPRHLPVRSIKNKPRLPACGCPALPHVPPQILDANPVDSWNPQDELRFRGDRYPVGTQLGELYTITLETHAPAEKVVTQWERPCIRFYR
jgi:hypothetical protein